MQQHHLKVAAHSRLERKALEKLGKRNHAPSALKTLDPLAQTVSLAEDDKIIAKARQEVLAAQQKMAHMRLFTTSGAMKENAVKKLTVKPALQLHRAVESHFGVVFSKDATPAGLQGGRVTMLANGAKKGSSIGEMMLAERDNAKLHATEKQAAGQIKHLAHSLLSSQRAAASELHDLEKHFG